VLRTTLLCFDSRIPDGVVTYAPSIPTAFGRLTVEKSLLAGGRIDIDATGTSVKLRGLLMVTD
jgi:hypothetical protein